ncbi:YrdB family protein [Siminovitchia sediminis]|uniref:YrdB family protein n=1 Tax=Siminovitchia sediminis TaxID=1274353 RepID=A0ABW4KMQ4_9BACI
MEILRPANLALRFLLEICALLALGYWGFQTGNDNVMMILLGIGTPILTALVWGVFGSPNAIVKLSMPLHICLELIVFGTPAIALYAIGKHQIAWIYGLCVIFNRLFMFVWKQ